MKMLSITVLFSAILLSGCGGSKDHSQVAMPTSSASSTSEASLVSSSSSTSNSVLSNTSSSSAKSSVVSSSYSSSSSSSSKITTSSSSSASAITFTLTSNSFVADGSIPIKYSCFNSETSPNLKWEITSDAVKSFALVMEDMDAIAIVGHPYVHWNVYNIPISVREIAEGATLRAMPLGSIEGANEDKSPKYAGPCPPPGSGLHHYYFALYALNKETLPVNAGKSLQRKEFEAKYANDIITKTELIGTYSY